MTGCGVSAQPTTQPFTFSIVEHTLPAVRQGDGAWGDYDRDGDLDVLLAGVGPEGAVTSLFRNDGPAEDGSVRFTAVQSLGTALFGAAAWGDYDGDGDLDLVVQGSTTQTLPYQPVTTLYRNDDGTLVPVDAGLPGLHSGAVAWGDYDLDGDLDLLLTGVAAPELYLTEIYRNDGQGRFTAVGAGLAGTGYGDAAWGDYDGDLDLDVVLTGATGSGIQTAVYENRRGDGFVRVAVLEPLVSGSVAWEDADGDGDLDVLLTGARFGRPWMQGHTQYYRNDGSGRFTPVDAGLTGVLTGTAAWGDYDDDGDPDILLIGLRDALGGRVAEVYENDGAGSFTKRSLLLGVGFVAADWGDYDGDGDLDLLAGGFRSDGLTVTMLYENRRLPLRPPPTAPERLHAMVESGRALLSWDVPSTVPDATFNVRVGTEPGGSDVVSAMADPVSGRRYLAGPGNAGRRAFHQLEGLPDGTYYWSVQTLNGSYAASPFAPEGRFSVVGGVTVGAEEAGTPPVRFAGYPPYPNPFDRETTIRYDLPRAEAVTFTVYDLLGRVVWKEHRPQQPAGTYTIVWDGRDHSGRPAGAGLYLYDLQAGKVGVSGTVINLQ